MPRFTRKEIEDIYAKHPLRKDTILRRLLSQRGSLEGLSEPDLAEDPVTKISDQNHLGGMAFTRQLAEGADISDASRVLDLGCGLGGSARVLAWLFGCRVQGIDLSAQRIGDARDLTELVGLSDLVAFECADVMSVRPSEETADVLWGQGAWSHLEDKGTFLQKWSKALMPSGRIGLEDVCLLRQPVDAVERDLLRSLEDHWTSYLIELDGADGWLRLLAQAGFAARIVDDRSGDLLEHFVGLKNSAHQLTEPVNEFEQHAWQLAIQATEADLIGYFRVVADRVEA